MYKADKLFDEMMKVKSTIEKMEVKDEASVAEYFKLYTELIYDHKLIGSVYDIYADDAVLRRENGLTLNGAHGIMQDILKLTAAFPDLKLQIRDYFAVKSGNEYKVFLYYAMDGENRNASVYGPATGKQIRAGECISMSMMTVGSKSGRWQILREFTMHSMECIKAACKAEA